MPDLTIKRHRYFFQPARSFFLAGLIAAAFLSSCKATYQTRDDFQTARQRTQKGDTKVTPEIMSQMQQIPPALRTEAIDTVAQTKGPESQQALQRMLEMPETSSPELKSRILARMMERQDPQTAEILLSQIQKDPSLLNDEAVRFFGEKKFTPAIPVIIQAVDQNRSVAPGMTALGLMPTPETQAYLLKTAATTGHPARVPAISALASLPSSSSADRNNVIVQILSNRDKEPKEVVQAAMTLTARTRDSALDPAIAEIVRSASDDPQLRTLALDTLSKSRGIEAEILQRDLMLPLAAVQASSMLPLTNPVTPVQQAQQRNFQEQPLQRDTARQQMPVADTTRNRQNTQPANNNRRTGPSPAIPRTPNHVFTRTRINYTVNYRQKVADFLFQAMPEDQAQELLSRVNNVLLSYSENESSWSEFIFQAYKKEFQQDDNQLKQMMKRGLSAPGGLSAVLHSVHEQYETHQMRSYAVSRLFGIPLWQAAILLEFGRGQ